MLRDEFLQFNNSFSRSLEFFLRKKKPYIRMLKQNSPLIYVDFHESKPKEVSLKQIFSKALGLNHGVESVLDATAGWANDSLFMLACKNSLKVTALESHPLVYYMLAEELERHRNQDNPWSKTLSKNFKILHKEAHSYLEKSNKIYDTIYLDPMFFNTKKTLSSKKIQCLELLQTSHPNPHKENLFSQALKKALRRVVVKRPLKSSQALHPKPSLSFKGKSLRYDVYLVNSKRNQDR